MSYAIGYIFYGINLNNSVFSSFQDDIEYLHEMDMCITQYSGNGETPRYLGWDFGGIDECDDIRTSALKLKPTTEELPIAQAELQKQIQAILDDEEVSQEFKDLLVQQHPDSYLVWGSS